MPLDNVSLALVSVIIRSMDRETLVEALDSLAKQTYGNLEIVLVNAKGAQHRELSKHHATLSVRYINQGGQPLSRSQAANAGLDAAGGKYLAFLDDDDVFDPDHLSSLVVALQAEAEATVVYSGVRCMDRGDAAKKISRTFGKPLGSSAQLLAGNFIPIHAPLFPRYLLKHARIDETLETYEDWDFWLQLAQHAKFVYTHRVTATYFTGGSSGVSPQAPDWDAVRRASQALYAKWMRITPDDFRNISNLYHSAVAQRDAMQEELAELKANLDRAHQESRQSANQLQLVYDSRSWRLTGPFRQFMNFVNQLFNR